MGLHTFINEGIDQYGHVGIGKGLSSNDNNELLNRMLARCNQAMADQVLQFILFGLAIVFLTLGYLRMRKGGGGATSYAV